MNRFFALVIVCIATHIFSQTTCEAHSYWLEVKGSGKANEAATVRLYFGEFENGLRENKPYFLKNMATFSAWLVDASGKRTELTLQADTNCYKATFMPTAEGVYTICMKEDTREVQDWTKHGVGIVRPIEYVKAVYAVQAKKIFSDVSPAAAALPIDLAPAPPNIACKGLCRQLLRDGKPLAGANVVLTDTQGKQHKYSSDAQGVVVFSGDHKGMVLIDVDVRDKGAGEYKGKKYEQVRFKYALTLSFTTE